MLTNFDDRKKKFDGYTVFRNKEVSKYRYWTSDEISKIKVDNRNEFRQLANLNKMRTFYSCLKLLPQETLIEFYTANNYQNYYVGKIISITRTIVNFKIINKDGDWNGYKKLKIQDINFFGFGTEYSKKIKKRHLTKSAN